MFDSYEKVESWHKAFQVLSVAVLIVLGVVDWGLWFFEKRKEHLQSTLGQVRGNLKSIEGIPLGNAKIHIRSTSGNSVSAESDSEGNFESIRIKPGSYELEIEDPPFYLAVPSAQVIRGSEAFISDGALYEFPFLTLPRGRQVSRRRDPSLAPPPVSDSLGKRCVVLSKDAGGTLDLIDVEHSRATKIAEGVGANPIFAITDDAKFVVWVDSRGLLWVRKTDGYDKPRSLAHGLGIQVIGNNDPLVITKNKTVIFFSNEGASGSLNSVNLETGYLQRIADGVLTQRLWLSPAQDRVLFYASQGSGPALMFAHLEDAPQPKPLVERVIVGRVFSTERIFSAFAEDASGSKLIVADWSTGDVLWEKSEVFPEAISYDSSSTQVAYVLPAGGRNELWRYDFDTKVSRKVDSNIDPRCFAFAPGGRRLLWEKHQADGSFVVMAEQTSSPPKAIARGPVHGRIPWFYRSGNNYAAIVDERGTGAGTLVAFTLDGTTLLDIRKRVGISPQFSPTGTQIAFLSDWTGGVGRLEVHNLETGQSETIPEFVHKYRWIDSKTLLILKVSSASNRGELALVTPSSPMTTRSIYSAVEPDFDVTADNKTVVFRSQDAKSADMVIAYQVETGKLTMLVDGVSRALIVGEHVLSIKSGMSPPFRWTNGFYVSSLGASQ